jgi:hypothetical protein
LAGSENEFEISIAAHFSRHLRSLIGHVIMGINRQEHMRYWLTSLSLVLILSVCLRITTSFTAVFVFVSYFSKVSTFKFLFCASKHSHLEPQRFIAFDEAEKHKQTLIFISITLIGRPFE